jgi:general stress protein 26
LSVESGHQDEIKKLAELVKGIRFAMLTTVEEDGTLRSRPMTTQEADFDGDFWFFTRASAPKVWEARHNGGRVSVSFADPSKNTYVSASGIATLVRDRSKMEELWKAPYKLFFPDGLDDPELALLKVSVETAEYWDSPATAIGRAFSFVRALATGDRGKLGDHAKVTVK